MRPTALHGLLVFVICCWTLLCGCASHSLDKALAPVAGQAVGEFVVASLSTPIYLGLAANKFHKVNHRWPTDYEELAAFLKRSDFETYQKLQAIEFSRIEFSQTDDDKLEINAEYSTKNCDKGEIKGLEVSADDETLSSPQQSP